MQRVLFISYDGLLDPLGYSQVQPYLRGLGKSGVRIWALSFEKPARLRDAGGEMAGLKKELASCGVSWRPLRYHKRFPATATLWDVCRGILAGSALVLRHRIGVIHARSYIAALIALVLCAALPGKRFLFDMRGFWADERVEGGIWPEGGLLYRLFKNLEKRFLARADAVVVLSRRGAVIINEWLETMGRQVPVAVIPTCVDLELFRPAEKPETHDCSQGLRLVYIGSLGTWYLIDRMLEFFAVLARRSPGSTFTMLTPSDPAGLDQAMARIALPAGIADRVTVKNVPYNRVPGTLREADCSIFFIRPTFSKQASCATKFAESLACGLPVVINSGIGDQDCHVSQARVGLVLESLGPEYYEQAAGELLELMKDRDLSSRCRETATREFSLEGAVHQYLELYRGFLSLSSGREDR
ncbi:MAG: glycosyltransferase [Gemmatimonadota bacterium]|nr:glycosyltransferase [Gemmatimonadota bacterium]